MHPQQVQGVPAMIQDDYSAHAAMAAKENAWKKSVAVQQPKRNMMQQQQHPQGRMGMAAGESAWANAARVPQVIMPPPQRNMGNMNAAMGSAWNNAGSSHVMQHNHHLQHPMAMQQQQMMMQQQQHMMMQQQMMSMSMMGQHQQHHQRQQQQQQQPKQQAIDDQSSINNVNINTAAVEAVALDEEFEDGYDDPTSAVSITDLTRAWQTAEADVARFTNREDTSQAGHETTYDEDPLSSALNEAQYTFATSNPHLIMAADGITQTLTNPGVDHMKEGLEQFERGDLSSAAMHFEAELQETPTNAMAWKMLGKTHAENDQDKDAIVCLSHAVEHDPYDLEALMTLGVSYVNELDNARALTFLKAWVEHNPK
jgi:hypothetical protein